MHIVGYVYMVRCADGSYYVGSHRGDDPDARIWEHNQGLDRRAYTFCADQWNWYGAIIVIAMMKWLLVNDR